MLVVQTARLSSTFMKIGFIHSLYGNILTLVPSFWINNHLLQTMAQKHLPVTDLNYLLPNWLQRLLECTWCTLPSFQPSVEPLSKAPQSGNASPGHRLWHWDAGILTQSRASTISCSQEGKCLLIPGREDSSDLLCHHWQAQCANPGSSTSPK